MIKGTFITLIFFLTGCSNSFWIRPGDVQAESFPIPNSTITFEIQKIHMHLFLAEYDFKLILKLDGREIDSADMTGDTGGKARIDVWKLVKTLLNFETMQSQFV